MTDLAYFIHFINNCGLNHFRVISKNWAKSVKLTPGSDLRHRHFGQHDVHHAVPNVNFVGNVKGIPVRGMIPYQLFCFIYVGRFTEPVEHQWIVTKRVCVSIGEIKMIQ
uniref:(northern house mosquito) hypothetical protein n=1 Tax=Culex pipiens TaxID=7175 RepID=A0A8D8FE43_CULPI